MAKSALEEAFNMLKGKSEEVSQKVNPFLSIINKPFQTAGQIGEIARTLPYDYSYRFANLSDTLQKAVKFNLPYREKDYSPLAKIESGTYEKLSPAKKVALGSISLEENLNGDIPTTYSSAKMLPYLQGRPETTAGKVLKQSILQNFGVYPAAQEYLQAIPFSEEKYKEEDIYGRAYNVRSGQRFITFKPGIERKEIGQVVGRHELLHQAVNVFGIKKLTNFVNAFNQTYQANPRKYRPIIEFIESYKIAYPEYFQENPTNETNELYAQIGATFGQDILNDPYIGKYYRNIFLPRERSSK